MAESPLAAAGAGLDLCVHCGFCLQACPTYLTLENESDSPRGRLVLMHGLLAGEIAPNDPALNEHISRCLGCRGCETACPSGVPYGHLLEATRATLLEHRPIPFMARLLLAVFARPALLAVAMLPARILRSLGVASLLGRGSGRLGSAFAMLAASRPGRFSRRSRPARSEARSPANGQRAPAHEETDAHDRTGTADNAAAPVRVAVFQGCVMRELYGHVNEATRAVLERNEYAVSTVDSEICCGALHAHAGDADQARRLALHNIAAFEESDVDLIAVNAAGCGAMLKEYPALFADDPAWQARAREFSSRVRDVSELLEARGPAQGAPVEVTVAYDAPCHLIHAQRISTAPLAVLRAVPGAVVVQTAGSTQCCGAAGIYNLIEPETAVAVLAPKLRELESSYAHVVCTGNPGCMMHIGAGLLRSGASAEIAHPVELLDYSYRKTEHGN